MTRRINAAGLALVKQWQGLKTKAYPDLAGVWTIGYGPTSAAGAPHAAWVLYDFELNAAAIRIGPEFAAVLHCEGLFRHFDNPRQLAPRDRPSTRGMHAGKELPASSVDGPFALQPGTGDVFENEPAHASSVVVGDIDNQTGCITAARKVSLMRSCQPGPSAWKYASTSLSIFSDTSSLVFGITGLSTAGAATFFAGLNNASAASFGLAGLRGVVATVGSFSLVIGFVLAWVRRGVGFVLKA